MNNLIYTGLNTLHPAIGFAAQYMIFSFLKYLRFLKHIISRTAKPNIHVFLFECIILLCRFQI